MVRKKVYHFFLLSATNLHFLSGVFLHFITGADKQDTDDNGILDGAEDADDDGLTNNQEYLLGTDPNNADTDKDGLTDYEEINTYHTDPLKHDCDEDNISDGDEISMGLDPLNPQTFGVPDSQYIFTQTIGAEKLEEINQDNLYSLAIDIQAAGNANNMLTINESTYTNSLRDNDAILGKAVELKYDENLKVDNVTIKFTIPADQIAKSTGKYNDPGLEGIKRFQIFKYDKTANAPCPVQTEFDTANNTLSVTTQEFGDYMVLDLDKWMYTLGIAPEAETPQAAPMNALPGDIPNLVQYNKQIDLVFAVDLSISMESRNKIDYCKDNILYLLNKLYDSGITANSAIVTYGEYGQKHTVHTVDGSVWAKTPEQVEEMFSNIHVKQWVREDHLDVMETIIQMPFRNNCSKVAVLISDDEGIDLNNNLCYVKNGKTTDDIGDELAQAGIITCAVGQFGYSSPASFNPLCDKTGGKNIDMYGFFYPAITISFGIQLYDFITDYFTNHATYTYIGSDDLRVRMLNAPVTKNGAMDTDEDWLTDWEETDQNALAYFAQTPYNDGDMITDLPTFGEYLEYSSTYDRTLFSRLNQFNLSALSNIRVLPILSDPAAVDSDYDGINDCDDEYPLDNSFKGQLHYNRDGANFSSDIEFNVDYRTLFSDNKSYSDKLAVMSSLFAADIYDDAHVSVTSGTTGGSNNPTALGNLFGLVGVEDININAGDYSVDKDDLTEFVIGHRLIEYNGVKKEIVVLVVRGTNGTNAEWSSNFDVGANTAAYNNAMGSSHPDWRSPANHKGFDVAANRVLAKVNDYFARHEMTAPKTILVTGHSRGAAIANILGAHFEDAFDFMPYTYTFAAPNTTTSYGASNYSTIFNIVNKDDLIPALPLEAWGFTKFGITKSISVANCYENMWGSAPAGTWEWLVGVDYNNDGGTNRTLKAFGKIAKDRNEVYIFDNSNDGKARVSGMKHLLYENAEKELADFTQMLSNEKLLKYCRLSITNSGDMPYYVEVNYCPAYLMQVLCNMTTEVGPKLGHNVSGKYARAKASFVASSGKVIIGGMTDPHLPITYYLIVHNNFRSRV